MLWRIPTRPNVISGFENILFGIECTNQRKHGKCNICWVWVRLRPMDSFISVRRIFFYETHTHILQFSMDVVLIYLFKIHHKQIDAETRPKKAAKWSKPERRDQPAMCRGRARGPSRADPPWAPPRSCGSPCSWPPAARPSPPGKLPRYISVLSTYWTICSR